MPPERDTSIRRVLDVLAALSTDEAIESKGLGVTQVSKLLAKDKSQVSRSLKVLAEYGLIDRDPDSLAYRLGWRLHSMALRSGNQRLLAVAEPVIKQLVSVLDESVYVSVLSGVEALTILTREPSHAIQATSRIWPVYSTSVGRVLLSDFTDQQIRKTFASTPIGTIGPQGISGIDELITVIQGVRTSGFAMVRDEFEDGLTAIAAPLHDGRGRVIAALGVSGPSFRFGASAEAAVQDVLHAAADIDATMIESPRPATS